jgi:uncharacterized protein
MKNWLLSLLFTPVLFGQVTVVDSAAAANQVNLNAAYTQSFDSLANTNTAPVPWTSNSTLPGWYAQKNSGPVTAYNPSQGGRYDLGSFGTLGNPDRALGSGLATPSSTFLHFGVRFVNASTSLIAGIDVSFDGEQWFYGDSFPGVVESLDFSYQIFDAGAGSLSITSGWTAVDDLKFVSPISDGTPVDRTLDGNLPANREDGIADSITGMTLAPGQEIWLRWTATNISSISDHALAIDDLSVRFTAVPEPAACAMLAGMIGLAAGARRRRR